MFELTSSDVESFLTGMIIKKEISASIDLLNTALVFEKNTRKTAIQLLAHQYTEKLVGFLETNERMRGNPSAQPQRFSRPLRV